MATTISTRSTQGGPLNSDHVNYLIFRYLQESGFEKASEALWRDWHRRPEFRDPEDLPFARRVQRHELISVIQDGLWHDELQARRRGADSRRYWWTGSSDGAGPRDTGRDGGVMENGNRPASRQKRKGRPPAVRAPPDYFPVPSAKRQRRSDGTETVINGDNMELDAKTPASGSMAEETRESDAASPAVEEELDAIEAAQRYDSMDVATQTEVKSGPKTSTMYIKLERPEDSILHAAWQPSAPINNTKVLLVTGGNLCRFYSIPGIDSQTESTTASHVNEQSLRPNSVVAAMAWRPDGASVSCAVDGSRDLPEGGVEPDQMLMDVSATHGTRYYQPGPPLHEPPGMVLSMNYNSDGTRLAVLSTNGKRGLVQIWETLGTTATTSPIAETSNDPKPDARNEPVAWHIFETPPLDMAWTAPDSFIVCIEEHGAKLFRLNATTTDLANGLRTPESFTTDSISNRGLVEQAIGAVGAELQGSSKVRYDLATDVAFFAAGRQVALVGSMLSEPGSRLVIGTKYVEEGLACLSIQPPIEGAVSQEAHTLVAATFVSGNFCIYRLQRGSPAASGVQEVAKLKLGQGPALMAAWAPDRQHLAVAGTDMVQIWATKDIENPHGPLSRRKEALVTWRPDPSSWTARRNGEVETDEQVPFPCLTWSADSKDLAFTSDQQIAIISFRPSLAEIDEEVAAARSNPDSV